MSKPIGDEKVDPSALLQMRERGGTWVAYQNMALDSASVGHLQFLKYGECCTFKEAPEKYPNDWKYLLVGKVDLKTGRIA